MFNAHESVALFYLYRVVTAVAVMVLVAAALSHVNLRKHCDHFGQ
jgi:hypothetical protein